MFTETEKAYLLYLLQHEKNEIQEDIKGHAAHGENDLNMVNSIINKIN